MRGAREDEATQATIECGDEDLARVAGRLCRILAGGIPLSVCVASQGGTTNRRGTRPRGAALPTPRRDAQVEGQTASRRLARRDHAPPRDGVCQMRSVRTRRPRWTSWERCEGWRQGHRTSETMRKWAAARSDVIASESVRLASVWCGSRREDRLRGSDPMARSSSPRYPSGSCSRSEAKAL